MRALPATIAPLGSRPTPGLARDPQDTEDVVQDTLLQSIKQLDGFTPEHERAFCGYVCQALRNRITDIVRRASRRPAGTAGRGRSAGPITRDRTFLMVGYQGFYENIPFPETRSVPTEAQLRGDFSQTFTAQGQVVVIYDPVTTSCNAAGQCTRQPFPGNVIPSERWHPVSRALLPHIPRPNAQGTLAGTGNFVSSPNLGRYRYQSVLSRVDHVFNSAHRLSASVTGNWGLDYRNENGLPEPAIRSNNYPTYRRHYLTTVGHVWTAESGTTVDARFSWDRFDEPHEKEYGNVRPDLPFSGPYQLGGVPFPQINLPGYENMFPRNFRQYRNDAYAAQGSIARSFTRHLLKAGAAHPGLFGLVELPFGRGRRFGGNTQGLVASLIGGWQVNVIGEIRSTGFRLQATGHRWHSTIGLNSFNLVPDMRRRRGGEDHLAGSTSIHLLPAHRSTYTFAIVPLPRLLTTEG